MGRIKVINDRRRGVFNVMMGYNFMIKPNWLLYDLIFSLAERHHYPCIIVWGEAYPRNRFYTGRRIAGEPEYV